MNQWDFVYAWNYKQPDKKVRTRFLHRLDGIKPSNICVSPDTLDTYPKKINLRRYDMAVPVDSNKPSTMPTKQTPPTPVQIAVSILAVLYAIMAYTQYVSTENISYLVSKHYDLAWKVSGIEIKSDDTANQLMLSLENQYWEERFDAANIAEEAGLEGYRKMVLINPDLHVVRLSNLDGDEISVNYLTKVITTHGVDY